MAIKYDALGNIINTPDVLDLNLNPVKAVQRVGARLMHSGIKAKAKAGKGSTAGKTRFAVGSHLTKHAKKYTIGAGAAAGVGATGAGYKKIKDEQDKSSSNVNDKNFKKGKPSFGKKSDKKDEKKGGNPFGKKGGKSFGKKDDKKGFGGKPAFGKKTGMKDAGLGQSMRKRHVKV